MVEKWKKVSCPELTLTQLSDAGIETSGRILDGTLREITIFPPGFPRGLHIAAGFDVLYLRIREPLRTETVFRVHWSYFGQNGSKDFTDRDLVEDWIREFQSGFINPPECTITEVEVEIWD